MMIKKHFFILLAACFVCLCGCKSKQNASLNSLSDHKNGTTIGVSVIDSSNLYYSNLVNGIKKEASRSGIQIIVKDAKSNAQTQAKDIQYFIDNKTDAIIVAAMEKESLDPVLLKAKKAGIKVVAQSTKVENCDMFISADEWDMGHMLGAYVGKWIRDQLNGEAEYAMLNYPKIDELANREKGIRDGISEFAPHARLAVTIEGASNPTQAYEAGLKILHRYPNVKVIVGTNDNGAVGAYNAYQNKRMLSDKMLFGGVDASSDALSLIKKNTTYRCTVDTMPEYNGILDVEFTLKLLKGQTVPERFKIQTRLITN